MKTLCTG